MAKYFSRLVKLKSSRNRNNRPEQHRFLSGTFIAMHTIEPKRRDT